MLLVLALGLMSALACNSSHPPDGPYGPHFHHHTGPDHGPQCVSIEAASDISFSRERSQALVAIASLPDLSRHEQRFVLEVVFSSGGFESDMLDVLVALSANPDLDRDTREFLEEFWGDPDEYHGGGQRLFAEIVEGVPTSEGTGESR